MPKIQSQEQIWNKIAAKWNKFREIPSPSVEGFLKDKKGKILDLGCGSGRNFSAFQKKSEIYAVDFSKKMLDYAKLKAKKLKLKVKFTKSESNKLKFQDNFFYSAICIALLHCIDKKSKRQETIKELFRVLKPKAKALISVWGRNSPRLRNKPKECYVSWSIKDEKQERYTYIYDKEELEQELKSAGFKIINSWEERNLNIEVKK
jgi:tRNA (uracil-5-)-methyltransferase TRM9